MRAYEISEFGIDNLEVVEKQTPSPDEGQVLVRVSAVSLNYRDVMVVRGTYNPRMKLPAIPFSDAAGEVIEIGSGVTRWAIGDRVCSTVIPGWVNGGLTTEKARSAIGAGGSSGMLAEVAIFDQESLVKTPSHLSDVEAATLPCAAVTAWHALNVSGAVQQGDTVLLLGTGGVSIFALQIAITMGARVIITSSSDEKLAKAKALGAAHLINYREHEDWERLVLEFTAGLGVDHVIEVGGIGTLGRSIKAVRTGGHIALVGALTTSGDFNPVPVFMRGIKLQGIFVGSREMFENLNAALEAAELRPVIDRTFTFENAQGALRYMAAGTHFGKVAIELRH